MSDKEQQDADEFEDDLVVPADGGDDDEDFEETEVVSQQRTSVEALMIPLADLDGWQGGDPPTEGFTRSVRRRMRQPILVEDTGRKKGRYRIVDGRRRVKAIKEFAKEDGITHVAAVIEDAEVSDLTPITMNLLRSDNVIDSARRVWARLDKGQSDKDIALDAAEGVAEEAKRLLPTIRGLRDMQKLLPELIEAVEKKKMSPWSARMAARQPEVVQKRLVAILNETGKVTPDDVVAARRAKQLAAAAAPDITDAIEDAPADLGDNDDFEHDIDEFNSFDPEGRNAYGDSREDVEELNSQYQGATSDGKPSISAQQRKASAVRLLVAAAKELGFITGTWTEIEDCIGMVEDVVSTLNDLNGGNA